MSTILSLESALAQILASIRPLPSENIPLNDSPARLLAASIRSPVHLPPADNSSMDGYAVRSADLVHASSKTPVTLRLLGACPAGQIFRRLVKPGACVRLYTGSVLPQGANAVVMQEDVESAGDHIIFREPIAASENVRFRGEDVKKNSLLAPSGTRLTPGLLALLASAGVAEVRAARRPTVALLATGSELREPGQRLAPGAIYESNRLSLDALAAPTGAIIRPRPLVSDHEVATRKALRQAFARCDVVVTTGGVSVGDLDYVRAAFTGIGGQIHFWGISLKPGKPFAFGTRDGKLFFGLPGNPVSALVAFFLLVRPALLRLQGAGNLAPPTHPGTLSAPLLNHGDRRHFMRVTVNAAGQVHSAGSQASHLLRAVAHSHGLVDVPPNTTLPTGAAVQVLRWD